VDRRSGLGPVRFPWQHRASPLPGRPVSGSARRPARSGRASGARELDGPSTRWRHERDI